MQKIGMVSLGCPKNQIDAEIMLKSLSDAGFELTPNEAEAEIIIVNTCGFIESAKAEAIENILEVSAYKKDGNLKTLIVTGCLAERYRDDIKEQMPEVDVVVGLAGNNDIVNIVKNAVNGRTNSVFGKKEDLKISGERILTTPFYTAYIKIAEGCDNCCTYCAIPGIRGKYRSRKKEDILKEAESLAKSGVKELVVVAQDTTRYGTDLYGEPKLADLLNDLCKVEGIEWIRILYTYPELITDRLINTIAQNEKIVNYLDIPLQHASGEVLRRMNRSGDKESLLALIEKIRAKIPDITLRTTFITGFPGETEDDFTELCEFVKEVKFDRVGCFAYSEEEDTPAASFPDQVPMQLRVDRSEIVMNDQLGVTLEKNALKCGSTVEVLVEGYDDYIKCFFGRSHADAPDIDGKVFFTSKEPLHMGDIVNVLINDSLEYDLLGEKI
jgi:ribosomal protein S12 methylthiotransferase